MRDTFPFLLLAPCGRAAVGDLAAVDCAIAKQPAYAGKPHFDLEAYVVHRLIAAGIDEIEAVNLDTYPDDSRFFSFRRSTHRGEADYGRQLSAIAIPG